MKGFNVLLTCCGQHISERIADLKNNPDGVKVRVYVCNCNKDMLPYGCDVDGAFVVPPIHHPDYIDHIIKICKENDIKIIVPTVTLELEFMSSHKSIFDEVGIHVSISSYNGLLIANNKLRLYNQYPQYMPKTLYTKDYSDILSMAEEFPNSSLCCKLTNHCGGNGFAIINDKKAKDITLFNKRGENRYCSLREMGELMEELSDPILIQEYIHGQDYSVSLLCVNGRVTHICGYVGYSMLFGAIEHGEIVYNEEAYKISTLITSELKLDGNVCFDFRINEHGEVILLEINPRVNASLPFVTRAGVNMLYLRCKNLLGDYSDSNIEDKIKYGLQMKKYHESRYFI